MMEVPNPKPSWRDFGLGLALPLPLFFQADALPSLYQDPWDAPEGLGLPLAAFAVGLLAPDWRQLLSLPRAPGPRLALQCFVLWVLGLAAWSAWGQPVAGLHGLQWTAPWVMVPYACLLAEKESRLRSLLTGLVLGTGCGLLLLLGLGCWELAATAGFPGRITQNRFFPGMYQLYNYVPVSLVLFGLFAAGICARAPSRHWQRWTWFFLLALPCVPLLTGVRGCAWMVSLGAPWIAWRWGGWKSLAAWGVGTLALWAGIHRWSPQPLVLEQKTLALWQQPELDWPTRILGQRAEIMHQYFGLVQQHPWLGLRLLPPALAEPASGVVAKGAHNFYLDTLAWAGPLALASFLALVFFALRSLPKLFSLFPPQGRELRLSAHAALAAAPPVLLLLSISSNLRTPLREPLSALCGFLLLGFLLAWAENSRRD